MKTPIIGGLLCDYREWDPGSRFHVSQTPFGEKEREKEKEKDRERKRELGSDPNESGKSGSESVSVVSSSISGGTLSLSLESIYRRKGIGARQSSSFSNANTPFPLLKNSHMQSTSSLLSTTFREGTYVRTVLCIELFLHLFTIFFSYLF